MPQPTAASKAGTSETTDLQFNLGPSTSEDPLQGQDLSDPLTDPLQHSIWDGGGGGSGAPAAPSSPGGGSPSGSPVQHTGAGDAAPAETEGADAETEGGAEASEEGDARLFNGAKEEIDEAIANVEEQIRLPLPDFRRAVNHSRSVRDLLTNSSRLNAKQRSSLHKKLGRFSRISREALQTLEAKNTLGMFKTPISQLHKARKAQQQAQGYLYDDVSE